MDELCIPPRLYQPFPDKGDTPNRTPSEVIPYPLLGFMRARVGLITGTTENSLK